MHIKYLLNINSNHKLLNINTLKYKEITNVFDRTLQDYEYKDEKYLNKLCYKKYSNLLSENKIGYDEPVYIIYSGLASVFFTFLNILVSAGIKIVVLFEDKDNKGYYAKSWSKDCL